MELVLVNNKNNKAEKSFFPWYYSETELQKNIKFCNQAIKEFIDPIIYNNNRIKVTQNISDYYKVMELTYLLRSSKTRKLLKTVKKARYQKGVAILNGMPMNKVKRLLNNNYDILSLINSIQILLKEEKRKKITNR